MFDLKAVRILPY